MVVYLALIIWCVCTGYLSQHTKVHSRSAKKILSMMPILAIFIISAIRYNVGTDYSGTYTMSYYKFVNGGTATMTLLPTLIYKTIIRLGLDLQWFFAITSFLICYFTYKSIEDQSLSKTLSYYVFICGCCLFFGFNGIRQAIGMSMFYYSLRYLGVDSEKSSLEDEFKKPKRKKKNNWITKNINAVKYIIINLISTGFHISGVVCVPLFFTLKKRTKLKTKIIIIVGCLLFSNLILPFIIRLINMTRYSYYITNSSMFSQNSLNVSMYINIFLFICYEYYFYRNKQHAVTDRDIVYGNIHFYGLIVTMFVTSIPLAYRFFYTFRYIEFLSFPNLISHVEKKYRALAEIALVAILFAYFILMIGRNNSRDVLPYMTIFDK